MGVSVDMSASHSVSASLPRLLRQRLSALMLATSLGLAAPVAMAQSLPPPDIGGRSWFLFDVSTNTVLYSQAPDERVEPASLTKLMTAYVVFEALRDGTLQIWKGPLVTVDDRELLPSGKVGDDRFLEGLMTYVKGVEGQVPAGR